MLFAHPKRFLPVVTLLGAGALAACDDDGPTATDECTGDECAATISTDITASRTLYADTVYTISGFVKVASGATLTIEAGTTILGDYDVPGSSLFVLRGATINAQGDANAPIVFTSERPAAQRQPGDWGGLIIIGGGQINRGSPTILEGTGVGNTTTNPPVDYSGGTVAGNSGTSGNLRYVRVEFAGYATSTDTELNSFTFAAVGSGTQANYLQALAGLDDSFEWFGGAMDAKYLVSYESGDDHFDMSEGYQGRLQHLIAFQSGRLTPRAGAGSFSSDPQGIENDGCNGTNCLDGRNSQPLTIPVVANFTLVGTGAGVVDATSGGIGLMLRRGTGGHYVNGVVARWPKAAVSIPDAETMTRVGEGNLTMRNVFAAETPALFLTTNALDATANALQLATATTTASLFTAFPTTTNQSTTEDAFDWTLQANAAPATGGLATFPAGSQLATRAGTVVAGTAYRGAAGPTGTKWWAGWTNYERGSQQ